MAPQRHAPLKSFGVFNQNFGADKFGFHDLKSISYNFDAPSSMRKPSAAMRL